MAVAVVGALAVVVSTVAVRAAEAAVPVAAQPSTPCWDISGTWHTLQGGSRGIGFTFSQTGSTVTGTADDGAGLTGTFTGNVTGDHVDVIVTWNFQKSDGSTLEGEYEATISDGTLTGSTHDVTDPSSHATWTASGGPTKDCSGTEASNPSDAPTPRDPEAELLDALSGFVDTQDVFDAAARIRNRDEALAYDNAVAKAFSQRVSADSDIVSFARDAALTAAAKNANGTYAFPAAHALFPVILKMLAHAAEDKDPNEAHMYQTAAGRLLRLALGDALKVGQ